MRILLSFPIASGLKANMSCARRGVCARVCEVSEVGSTKR